MSTPVIILTVAASICAVYLIFAIIASHLISKRKRERGSDPDYTLKTMPDYADMLPYILPAIKKNEALARSDAYLTSFDGLKLHANVFETENARSVVLLAHGYRSKGRWDFAIVMDFYLSHGFNILRIDQRCSADSEGKYITFGVCESRDIAAWADYADKKWGLPILLDGISMGATSVLAASVLDLPESVHGIVADCGFRSPDAIIRDVAKKRMHLPGFLVRSVYPFLRLHGFDPYGISTVEAMKKNKIPVFFAHGQKDGFVPCENTLIAYDSCTARKHLFLCAEADHGKSYFLEPDRYRDELKAFFPEFFT